MRKKRKNRKFEKKNLKTKKKEEKLAKKKKKKESLWITVVIHSDLGVGEQ